MQAIRVNGRYCKMIAPTHCPVTPLLQNGVVRLGRGSAGRRSSRLVPAGTALGDQKNKALSILRSRNTCDAAEKQQ